VFCINGNRHQFVFTGNNWGIDGFMATNGGPDFYRVGVQQRRGPVLDPAAVGLYVSCMANAKKPKRKAAILGLGLDSDGHKRVTKGDNFLLVGGTHETHEVMTEKTIKLNEKLKARGKQLETVSKEEFDEIAHEVGLKKFEPRKN